MNAAVRCPTCGRSVEWNDNSPWRPFCSERCRLIDLGAWAAQRRSIPGSTVETEDKPKDEESG